MLTASIPNPDGTFGTPKLWPFTAFLFMFLRLLSVWIKTTSPHVLCPLPPAARVCPFALCLPAPGSLPLPQWSYPPGQSSFPDPRHFLESPGVQPDTAVFSLNCYYPIIYSNSILLSSITLHLSSTVLFSEPVHTPLLHLRTRIRGRGGTHPQACKCSGLGTIFV